MVAVPFELGEVGEVGRSGGEGSGSGEDSSSGGGSALAFPARGGGRSVGTGGGVRGVDEAEDALEEEAFQTLRAEDADWEIAEGGAYFPLSIQSSRTNRPCRLHETV